MKTPIYDFLKNYSSEGAVRLHMPGHKGKGPLGEGLDITEISGADSLYEAEGIIAESEGYASELFGCPTLYSTEGSSLAIRAMLHLALSLSQSPDERPLILAGRNAHKVFISAAALIDFDVEWISGGSSYLCCEITAKDIEARLASGKRKPIAVYITSPDYLGNMADIRGIARVCHKFGVLLLVDNAHGAYLKFLPESAHPMDLGADMCASSAHKTLPTLTGGAYLHISKNLPVSRELAKSALSLYGSTSPSYLILASLDLVNGKTPDLSKAISLANSARERLTAQGFALTGDEPLKITILPKSYGYLGTALAEILQKRGIYSEFSDPDYLVLMLSENTAEDDISRLICAMESIPRLKKIEELPPNMDLPKVAMTPREAIFSAAERTPVLCAEGKILSSPTVGCPPAVPLVISGEIISADAIRAMLYYGVKEVNTVKGK